MHYNYISCRTSVERKMFTYYLIVMVDEIM